MPIKLIMMLIVAVLTAIFTGYNLGNTCDVWIIHTFKDVPVSVTIIISLMAGVIITLPFTMGKRVTREDKKILKADRKAKKIQAKKDKKAKKSEQKTAETASSDNSVPAIADETSSDSSIIQESTIINDSDSEYIPSEAD